MMSFHDLLVSFINSDDLKDLKQHCYVFPTKRGGVFFKRALIKKFEDQNFMMPSIMSIEEFIEQMTQMQMTDELTLLLQLFSVYKKKDPDLKFDDFYAWGKIILKDYDEIDRYMADAQQIYSSLQQIKEVDNVFGYNEEFREVIERYRTLTEKNEKTKLLTEFLKIWKEVGAVYEEYQEALQSKEMVYGGMLYRKLAEVLSNEHFDHEYSQYHFCGFNALSKSEEVIFDALVKAEKAQLYWDLDEYFVNDLKEEAGDFIREYQRVWPDSHWLNADSLSEKKDIVLHSVPQNQAQVQVAADQAFELINAGAKPEDVAIVLADEKLLIPLLYALPLNQVKVNVTMGYPMRSTVVYDFVLSYLSLMKGAKLEGDSTIFSSYDLRPFLSNAYTGLLEEDIYQKINQWLLTERKNKVSLEELKEKIESQHVIALLSPQTEWQSVSKAITNYLTAIFYHFKEIDEGQTDREFIYFFLKSLNQLNDYLEGQNEFSLRLMRKILQEHFRSVKIPFEGEPVKGLQIMGFLESRTLDFKHLIILSANEGRLPTPRNLSSYIPYGLRKVFQLPTFEEQDAIYAYHFKRLLQRAEKVHFVYDNTTSGDSTGEKSRFILQQELLYENIDNISVQHMNYEGFFPPARQEKAVVIEKDEAVQQMLTRYIESDEGRHLSPTSLSNYISCSLKFYLQNVARISEFEEVDENIDARVLGIVVHRVLEELYEPFVGKEIGSEQVNLLKSLVSKKLKAILKDEKLVQDYQQLTGKDLVTQQVMEQMVQKVLDLDLKDAPFTIVGLEAKDYTQVLEVQGKKVLVGGTIDRMDMKDDVLRITDYKTGDVKFVNINKKTDEEQIDPLFEDSELKSGFQAYLYASLVQPHFANHQVKVGVTSMKLLNKGTQWLNGGQGIRDPQLGYFDQKLKGLVHDIFDSSKAFEQTEDIKECQYCKYKGICNR